MAAYVRQFPRSVVEINHDAVEYLCVYHAARYISTFGPVLL